ncbi:hypothetical protein ACRDNQ_07190 [Palleronia sp. KMU-117]|uniref:hypothetical protein n=1 Tax=Palleronia sp. KMU-117 TaxID=3434108 RepID=UPI003D734839
MTERNLLEVARQRRLEALASLPKRADNLFSLAEYRTQKRREVPVTVFKSSRSADINVFAIAQESRMAA